MSVVMAVRNGAGHIARALDSITEATCRPDEIVVVDGHSTDDTAAIAARHPLVRVIAQDGLGIAAAYNQGIAASRGAVIAFLSHDDLWAPGKLALQLAVLAREPEVALVFGMVRHELAGIPPAGFRHELIDRTVPGYIVETMLARREVFARVGPFDTALTTAEDVDWIARARDAGCAMRLVPEVVLTKRIGAGNASLVDPRGREALMQALRLAARRRRGG